MTQTDDGYILAISRIAKDHKLKLRYDETEVTKKGFKITLRLINELGEEVSKGTAEVSLQREIASGRRQALATQEEFISTYVPPAINPPVGQLA